MIGSENSNSSSSYFLVDEEIVDFTLILEQPTIQDFKDIDTILQTTKLNINIALKDYYEDENEEYNVNDNNLISIPNQLEEGFHMLIEENIKINLSNEPNSPKTIQLGKSLTEIERKEFITILKEK